ncbi:MAG TPA: hypothetical protein VGC42_26140, partial [Kofleriaceae bacterium]
MTASLAAVVLGLLLGLRHAFEPDHLTAVSTLVVESRDPWRGVRLGAIWGLGHTLSLAIVGTLLLATGRVLPARAAAGFELVVAAMLIVLGVRAVWRALRGPAVHAHDGSVHRHGHRFAGRPLIVGLIHGLAGSGAITALVFAELPTLASRVGYIVLFGLGSSAGMAIASGVAGASLHRLAARPGRRRVLAVAAGLISIALGIAW